MKNSQLRKIANEKMKGKYGKSLLYVMLYMLICGLLSFVPFTVIIAIPLGFGLKKSLSCLSNGEEVKAFDFFTHGMDNFGNVWCTYLLILLRILVALVLFYAGIIILTIINEGVLFVIGIVMAAIGLLWGTYIGFKYSLIQYEIIYNPQMKARELVKKCAKDSKGNLWKIARMHFYYGLVMILSALTLGLIVNILTNFVQSSVISVLTTLGTILLSYVIVILVQPKMITSLNELYKYITKEE